MSGAGSPRLHQATGLSDYDAAAWTSLPPVRGVLQGSAGWGVLLQEPDVAPQGFRAVEVDVPEQKGAVLLLALAAGRNEGHLSGTGAARPLRVGLRRGDALLVPPGTASRWYSSTGQERVLHLHLALPFLEEVAAQGGMRARPESLPPGLLRRDATLDFLLRHIVRQIRHQEPGWRIAIGSALTLAVAQMLAAAPPGPRAQHGATCRPGPKAARPRLL
ncbi:hypothetical protein [Falsiroseomonas selenitidurans]|uniref:Transcription regulator HTH AraC- type ligand binding domain-containing protein n=1 Tax=Falsiroseomonas selenitidurans TaxID=2716335 RepID=A0ABX1E9H5_9PROT|nr:hypothetical protein [Falsiroseomonas selenitidurans]NKC33875.1 hypothetical protein [Falsiroseomonas selenitidurans]